MTSVVRSVRRRGNRVARRRERGMTLIEMLVAMSILAFIAMAIYGAVDGMRRSQQGVERTLDRYREGRIALQRITQDLSAAYLSAHVPIDPSLQVVSTAFVGERDSPAAVLHFNSFANRRLSEGALESDQIEVSYFGSEDPDRARVTDLVRRVSTRPDQEPTEGGRVEVLATNIDLFHVEYLDPLSGRWREDWDSRSVVGEKGRLPLQVKVVLVLNDGMRRSEDSGRGKIRLVTKISLPIQDALNFALK